ERAARCDRSRDARSGRSRVRRSHSGASHFARGCVASDGPRTSSRRRSSVSPSRTRWYFRLSPMPTRSPVSESLEQLRSELAASASLSSSERERLERLIADVREHVDLEHHEPQSLADRLQDATAQFEESHPRLTLAIGAVAEALARSGI